MSEYGEGGDFGRREGGRSGGSRGGGRRSGGRSGGFRGNSGGGFHSDGGGFHGGGGGGRFSRSSEPKEMHKAVCSACGQECEVPFKPTEGRPVYCKACFKPKRDFQPRGEY